MFSTRNSVIKLALQESIAKREDEIGALRSEIEQLDREEAALEKAMLESMQAYDEIGPHKPD